MSSRLRSAPSDSHRCCPRSPCPYASAVAVLTQLLVLSSLSCVPKDKSDESSEDGEVATDTEVDGPGTIAVDKDDEDEEDDDELTGLDTGTNTEAESGDDDVVAMTGTVALAGPGLTGDALPTRVYAIAVSGSTFDSSSIFDLRDADAVDENGHELPQTIFPGRRGRSLRRPGEEGQGQRARHRRVLWGVDPR